MHFCDCSLVRLWCTWHQWQDMVKAQFWIALVFCVDPMWILLSLLMADSQQCSQIIKLAKGYLANRWISFVHVHKHAHQFAVSVGNMTALYRETFMLNCSQVHWEYGNSGETNLQFFWKLTSEFCVFSSWYDELTTDDYSNPFWVLLV